jgi:hypothetical protein
MTFGQNSAHPDAIIRRGGLARECFVDQVDVLVNKRKLELLEVINVHCGLLTSVNYSPGTITADALRARLLLFCLDSTFIYN